jgi:histone deacetylase complex regulatory component SIN3
MQVKNRFADRKDVYDTFLEIMKEFKAQRYHKHCSSGSVLDALAGYLMQHLSPALRTQD